MAVLVQDTFDRANSSTVIGSPAVGPAPVVSSGVGGISSNRLYASTATLVATWDAAATNVKMTATTQLVANSGRLIGFVLGYASATDYWLVHLSDTGGGGIHRQNVGGFFNYMPLANIPTAPTTIEVEHHNGIIRVRVAGVRVARLDTNEIGNPITATSHGFRITHTTPTVHDMQIEDSSSIELDSAGDTPTPGFSALPTDRATASNVFLYRGRDTKTQDLLGGF